MSSKFVLQQEDGTIANGNARGEGAVDLQMSRTSNTQVAKANYSAVLSGKNNKVTIGYGADEGSVVVGGVSNSVQANYAFIGGGSGNVLGGNDNYQVIVGGQNNGINASGGAFIGGGAYNSISSGGLGMQVIAGGRNNTGGSTYTVISGGQFNTANNGSHATVVGGYLNTASGQYSIVGGFGNTNSGGRGSLVIGYQNTSTDQGAFVSGQGNTNNGQYTLVSGLNNRVSQSFGTAVGQKAKSYIIGQNSIGNDFGSSRGISANQGDFQSSNLNVFNQADLSSGGTLTLNVYGYLTGTIPLLIPDGTNRAWNVTVKWVAVCTATGSGTTAVGDVAIATDSFMFKKVSGTSSIGTVQNLQNSQDATMAGATCSYAVGGSQSLQITFTAPASANATTFRVVAKVELTECAW